MNNIELYYYSGTGNSLHVARELQKRLPATKLIPILGLSKKGDAPKTNAEAVGFVYPIYFTNIPVPMRDCIKKLEMSSAKYTFSIATRGGTFCVDHILLKRLLKKKGLALNSHFVINMANNTPTGLVPGKGDQDWVNKVSPEKVRELEMAVQKRLDEIQRIITNKEKYPQKSSFNPFRSILEWMMIGLTARMKGRIPYYADETCTGCGTCERVCPSGKVRIKNNRPSWLKDVQCYYCFACFNFCPQQAILVETKYTLKDGRYRHPDITAKDIAGQKEINEQ